MSEENIAIVPGRDGILAMISLLDGQKLPNKWNVPRTIVFRRGKSTNWQLIVIKAYGNVWPLDDDRLQNPFKPDITKVRDAWGGSNVERTESEPDSDGN